MKFFKSGLSVLALALVVYQLQGQGEVPVNMYTGTANIEIPLWNVSSRELSEQVSLTYSTRGLRLNEENGPLGVSWSLTGGGSITREVRGLPDDYTGTGNDRRRGWLYQIYSTSTYLNQDVAAFSNSSDLSAATCTDEATDFNKLDGYGYNNDTQPDLFHYNVGGMSGSFVFDNSAAQGVRLIPNRDIKITPVFESGTKKLNYFTLTTNTGIVYEFTFSNTVFRYTQRTIPKPSVEFMRTYYELYARTAQHNYAIVTYKDEWKLAQVKSPSGDRLYYEYEEEGSGSYVPEEIKTYLYSGLDTTFVVDTIYQDFRAATTQRLTSIKSDMGSWIDFEETDGFITAINVKDLRSGSEVFIKKFDITYNYSFNGNDKRIITKIQEVSATDSLPPYRFDYYGALPFTTGNGQDVWGYSNGKTNTHLFPTLYVYPALRGPERFRYEKISGYVGTEYRIHGANRDVDTVYMQMGTLKMITYPWGGKTILKYEPNEYLDPFDNQTKIGGGLRIKSLAYTDGITTDVKIEKYYAYTDSTGQCSGRLINKPVFGMSTWEFRNPYYYSSTNDISVASESGNWRKFIAVFENDLTGGYTTQGSTIGYKETKVFRPGSGSARYEYELPGVYRDSVSGDWSATVNKFARAAQTPCGDLNLGANQSGINSFPYAPNPNFEYAQGLVKRKRSYDMANVLVEDVKTTYQDIGTAHAVYGVDYEQYPNTDYTAFYFGKYYLLTGIVKVPLKETIITYDANNTSKKITQSTEYIYGSANHKLLTQVKTTAGDGTIYRSKIVYPLDYIPVTPAGGDNAAKVIRELQLANLNGIPMEQYQTVQKPYKTEKVVAGKIIKFSSFGISGKFLPEYNLEWNSSSPDSAFTISYIDPSTKQFKTDDNYEVVNTILSYGSAVGSYANNYYSPISSVDPGRVKATVISGYSATVPIIIASDTQAGEFAFSDFEMTTSASFIENTICEFCFTTPEINYDSGRTGDKSLVATTDVFLTTTVSKGSDKYIFSGWVKHTGSPVTYALKLGPIGSTFFDQNFTITPTTPANTWEYFEFVIPVTGSGTFDVTIYPGTNNSLLDDVAFYPVTGSLTTLTYKFPFGATSTTNRNKSILSTLDGLGRVKYVKDKAGNILTKKVYKFTEN